MATEKDAIVFFDGDCLMCQGSVRLLNRLDGEDVLGFATLEGETAKHYGVESGDESVAFLVDGKVWRASEAVRLMFWAVGGVGWILAGILWMIPLPLREWGYRWVARNRKRLVKSEGCALLEQGMQEKMLP